MKVLSSIALLLLIIMMAGPAIAEKETMPGQDQAGQGMSGSDTPRAVMLGEVVPLEAKIVAINKHERTVTLEGPEGNKITIEADQRVRNFNELKVGDKVKARFFQAVVIGVGEREGRAGEVGEVETVTIRAPQGNEPSRLTMATVEAQATVEAINTTDHTITLKGPEGESKTFKTGSNVDLEKLKVGDTITARYIMGLAMTLEKE